MKKRKQIGNKLMESLTKDQVTQLLDVVFKMLDEKKINNLLSNVNDDLKNTLIELRGSKKSKSRRVISDKKFIEKWKDLWREWYDVVSEVGDEDGKYIIQEHHWEDPYFDSSAICSGLDSVVEKMLPFLKKIHELGIENDSLFDDAFIEIEENIDSYPEWIYTDDCESSIGNAGTMCILKWKLLHSNSCIDFIKKIIKFEEDITKIGLDCDTFLKLFTSLPEKKRKTIYEYIKSNRDEPEWKMRLKSTYSKWHKIYSKFSKEFDSDVYIENCREFLSEKWQYGIPIIKDLLKKGDKEEAEKFYEKTISSYIKSRNQENWQAEKLLIVNEMMYGYDPPEQKIVGLLEEWINITKQLGMENKTRALKIQLITYKDPFNWNEILKIIDQTGHSPIENLIEQWHDFTVHRMIGSSFNKIKINESWIKWLMEDCLDKPNPKFLLRTKDWLTSVNKYPELFNDKRKEIYILTNDLIELRGLKKQYFHLLNAIKYNENYNNEGIKSRQEWLKKKDGMKLLALLMNCWKNNIRRLVPDPGNSKGSYYESHALWLAAVKEINIKTFQKILVKWEKEHKRRKNLWEAIKDIN